MSGKITIIRGIAAPLLWDNVDTDALTPVAPYKRLGGGRDCLREVLFYEFRFTADGTPKPYFVLNEPQFTGAAILVAGENFGCGSSREVAVWSLIDYGFRAVIARSFAEIFEQNAYKNHLLPATVDAETHARLVRSLDCPTPPVTAIDLIRQCITINDHNVGAFRADEMGLEMIVNGMDEFALTARYVPDIQATQRRLDDAFPWLDPYKRS
ncbi:3-isopropylmalate dehydratase small subunit [Bradyrhizobium sp. 147]|uniref:3-isopropylmalate dehydratase small subunit n=1 Tax=unclassified Bradyrhizobium TaxID=2631580 RepID=UPI001FF91737|nr:MULTISPECIES: 3-isopropylmalate dehydratase small subunit [unclassified Bradyrhizobium]MCK1622502.1 3-isopropylmalate dehydratase small subunit [Bradyrhizobium sp. 160]MCK1678216.1 3-isopropylmalate dehydratase small subunit [Bradyrhizobium sp. 147]